MRDQIIEITGQTPFISTGERYERQGIIPNLQGSYWMQVYPPLTLQESADMPGTRPVMPLEHDSRNNRCSYAARQEAAGFRGAQERAAYDEFVRSAVAQDHVYGGCSE